MTLMNLIDAYAQADALEHQACLYGSQEAFAEAISVKHKSRTAVVEAVEKLERDAARMDWIQRNLFGHTWNGVIDSGSNTRWKVWEGYRHVTQHMNGDTFRDAIDNAMEATNGQGT